jgi:hypothetical protein
MVRIIDAEMILRRLPAHAAKVRRAVVDKQEPIRHLRCGFTPDGNEKR